MYHKELMMCYDVYTYISGNNQKAVDEVKETAYQMLKAAALWVYHKIQNYGEKERVNIFIEEYGGIAEALFLASDLVMKKEHDVAAAHKIFTAARFFKEDDVLYYTNKNINIFPRRHINSQIPKFLACCAEYQITGDTFYLTAAKNFFDMMADHMSYPDGGLGLHENYENPDEVSQAYEANETCCCYNMLRLADYLFKFTGDAKYAQYFEKVFYNHIMGAINTTDYNGEINAGKVYSTSSAFGYPKIYSNQRAKEDSELKQDAAFWCCCCSGQETLSATGKSRLRRSTCAAV